MDPNCAETNSKMSIRKTTLDRATENTKKAATGHAFSIRQPSKSMKFLSYSYSFCMLHLLPRNCSMCLDTFKNCPQIIPQTVPKRPQNVFKRRSQNGSEILSQKCPQMGGHLGTGDVPRAPRRPRRTDQDAPIADQTIARAPRCFQEASKSCPQSKAPGHVCRRSLPACLGSCIPGPAECA